MIKQVNELRKRANELLIEISSQRNPDLLSSYAIEVSGIISKIIDICKDEIINTNYCNSKNKEEQ